MSRVQCAQNKMMTYLYKEDEQKTVFATLAVKCGIAYRYAYIKGEEYSRELNQGFPYVLPLYIKHYFEAQGKKSINVTPYRCTTCFSLIADPVAIWSELEQLHSVLFEHEVDKEVFERAKNDAMESLRKLYVSPEMKSFFHILEFSEQTKGFLFAKFSTDLHNIDYETFKEHFDNFINTENAVLLLSGNPASEKIPAKLALTNETPESDTVVFCAEAIDPALQKDAHKVIAASEPFQMRCMYFSFSNEVSMVERYLLLSILAGQIDGCNRDIHIDAFDASITLLNDARLPSKYELRESLTKDFVETGKARILKQMDFDKNRSKKDFYSYWGNMCLNGIELSRFTEVVSSCTSEYVIQVFDRADPIIVEGTVILKKP